MHYAKIGKGNLSISSTVICCRVAFKSNVVFVCRKRETLENEWHVWKRGGREENGEGGRERGEPP